eukprot:COSAG01_NODE_7274_length_3274_cov_2.216063_5_plen_184_part_00
MRKTASLTSSPGLRCPPAHRYSEFEALFNALNSLRSAASTLVTASGGVTKPLGSATAAAVPAVPPSLAAARRALCHAHRDALPAEAADLVLVMDGEPSPADLHCFVAETSAWAPRRRPAAALLPRCLYGCVGAAAGVMIIRAPRVCLARTGGVVSDQDWLAGVIDLPGGDGGASVRTRTPRGY